MTESQSALRIVIPGGSGQIGRALARHFHEQGHIITVLSRHLGSSPWKTVSWIHEQDFLRAIDFLIERKDLEGCINICSPTPLPYRDFMRLLRQAYGVRIALPASKWMLELGAFFLRTETELVLKSRCVVPGRLSKAGFEFLFPGWEEAARDLVQRRRQTDTSACKR